jgi:hypothetical protein
LLVVLLHQLHFLSLAAPTAGGLAAPTAGSLAAPAAGSLAAPAAGLLVVLLHQLHFLSLAAPTALPYWVLAIKSKSKHVINWISKPKSIHRGCRL